MRPVVYRLTLFTGLLLGVTLPQGCAVNPATGSRQLTLMSEAQEVALGQQNDPRIVAQMGEYPDERLQQYVRELGLRLAATSERPGLPWTFRVLDDPLVNAFALPGGFIYVTRGILAHMNSEAELAGILGHEIGHVTARHSVSQISRARLAQVGLGVGMILRPELQDFGGLATAGLELLFLRYSREAEYQSDDLGIRYMTGLGYDPRQLAHVFDTLSSLSDEGGGGRPPEWASTHPDPRNRAVRVLTTARGVTATRVEREAFLRRLDGMVFGDDPRQGFFEGPAFLHPEMAFRLEFPEGWRMQNSRQAVQAVSTSQDAAVVLSLARQPDPASARSAFLASQGIAGRRRWDTPVNGLRAAWTEFQAVSQGGGTIIGVAGFIAHDRRVFQLVGFATSSAWNRRAAAMQRSLESFRPVTDRATLDVQPRRLQLTTLPAAMTIEEFASRFPSTIPVQQLALINGVAPGTPLEAGRLVKRVVGGPAGRR